MTCLRSGDHKLQTFVGNQASANYREDNPENPPELFFNLTKNKKNGIIKINAKIGAIMLYFLHHRRGFQPRIAIKKEIMTVMQKHNKIHPPLA